jgi:hypothetical protein
MVTPVTPNTHVQVVIKVDQLSELSTFDGVLPDAGRTYEIWPKIRFDARALAHVRESFPTTALFSVSVDGAPSAQQSRTIPRGPTPPIGGEGLSFRSSRRSVVVSQSKTSAKFAQVVGCANSLSRRGRRFFTRVCTRTKTACSASSSRAGTRVDGRSGAAHTHCGFGSRGVCSADHFTLAASRWFSNSWATLMASFSNGTWR